MNNWIYKAVMGAVPSHGQKATMINFPKAREAEVREFESLIGYIAKSPRNVPYRLRKPARAYRYMGVEITITRILNESDVINSILKQYEV